MRHLHSRFGRTVRCSIAFCLALALALAVSACSPKSPEEKVTATRAQYTVQLQNFTANMPPSEDDIDFTTEEAVAAEAGEAVASAMTAEAAQAAEGSEAEEGEEAMEEVEPESPALPEVILHLLVRFKGDEALPGITVEVTRQDPFGKEHEPTLHWIETAGMTKSDVSQVDLKLEEADFEEGDAFSVLLRSVVPPEERAGYREYAEAGP